VTPRVIWAQKKLVTGEAGEIQMYNLILSNFKNRITSIRGCMQNLSPFYYMVSGMDVK
jgi:hypothetical protein